MSDDVSQIRGTGRALLERGAARWWWALLVAGLVWFLIGWGVLRADYTSLATVGVLVGVVFLIAAVSEGGLAAVVTGGWKVWHVVLAVIFALAFELRRVGRQAEARLSGEEPPLLPAQERRTAAEAPRAAAVGVMSLPARMPSRSRSAGGGAVPWCCR
jgi:hypothetical protein